MIIYQAIYKDFCDDIHRGNLFMRKEDCLKEVNKLTDKPTIDDYNEFIKDLNDDNYYISFDSWLEDECSNLYYLVTINELTVY